MGSNYQGGKYAVDIVMCIDATGSMGPLIDLVKKNALSFYDDVTRKLKEKDKYVDVVRAKVIVFRDYVADGAEKAMMKTDFFNLPDQNAGFQAAVNGIEADGGGDAPEDGLEALGYAIKSKWDTSPEYKHRHIIVVWSDDATHPIGYGASAPGYPAKMAKSFSELTDWWGCAQMKGVMDRKAKRLIIYAPAKEYWTNIAGAWDNVLMYPAEVGKGMDSLTYEAILNAIAGSV